MNLLEPSGTFWNLLEPSGTFWNPLEPHVADHEQRVATPKRRAGSSSPGVCSFFFRFRFFSSFFRDVVKLAFINTYKYHYKKSCAAPSFFRSRAMRTRVSTSATGSIGPSPLILM
ncbi:unnamed protein product [Pylaiella littoralis]